MTGRRMPLILLGTFPHTRPGRGSLPATPRAWQGLTVGVLDGQAIANHVGWADPADRMLRRVLVRVVGRLDNGAERLHYLWVELCARAAAQLGERVRFGDGVPVGSLGDHCGIRISHEDDARTERDVRAS